MSHTRECRRSRSPARNFARVLCLGALLLSAVVFASGCSTLGPERGLLARQIRTGTISTEELRKRVAEKPELASVTAKRCVICAAIDTGRTEMAEILLDASPDPVANAKRHAFSTAVDVGAVDILELFLARGFRPSSEDIDLIFHRMVSVRANAETGRMESICRTEEDDKAVCYERQWPTLGAVARATTRVLDEGVSATSLTSLLEKVVELLAERNIESGDREELEALLAALVRQGAPVAKIIDGGAGSPLWMTVQSRRVALTRTLLEAVCPEHETDGCWVAHQPGSGPYGSLLHMAAGHCNSKMVALLLEYGAQPEYADSDGRTALHVATESGCARLLLEAGARPNVADKTGARPLDGATPATRRVLLEHGASESNWVRATCAFIMHAAGEPQFRLTVNNRCQNRNTQPIRCYYRIKWGCSESGPLTHKESAWCPESQALTTDTARCGALGQGKVRFDRKTGRYPAPNFCPGTGQTWRVESGCEIKLSASTCDGTRATWDGKACVPTP